MNTTPYNSTTVVAEKCVAREPRQTVHDLCEQIRKCHIETADILASIYCILTGNPPDVPGYRDPESIVMDLACEAERAEYIHDISREIREIL